MGLGTALLLNLLLAAVFLYALFLVVRAAVEAGIRRALDRTLLQPTAWNLVEGRKQQLARKRAEEPTDQRDAP